MTDQHEPREISDPIGQAIRATAADVQAPPALRDRLEQDRTRRGSSWRTRTWEYIAAGAALAAVIAAVVVFSGLDSGGGSPDAADAAVVALHARAASTPMPATDDARVLDRAVGGVRFPNYEGEWTAVGSDTGTVDGRPLVTVRYGRENRRVNYAIVDGAPLHWPDGALRTTPHGTPVVVFHRDGALAVAWRRGGHTCVLATRDTTLDELLEFVDQPA
jgi:hypothetical protein